MQSVPPELSSNPEVVTFGTCLLLDGEVSHYRDQMNTRTSVQIRIRHFDGGCLPSAAVFVSARQLTASLKGTLWPDEPHSLVASGEFTAVDCEDSRLASSVVSEEPNPEFNLWFLCSLCRQQALFHVLAAYSVYNTVSVVPVRDHRSVRACTRVALHNAM